VSHLPLTSKLTLVRNHPPRYESIQKEGFQTYLNQQVERFPKRKGLILARKFLLQIEDLINLNEIFAKYDEKLECLNKICIIDHIKKNSKDLQFLIASTQQAQIIFDQIGAQNSSPITKPRLRYLKYVLKQLGE